MRGLEARREAGPADDGSRQTAEQAFGQQGAIAGIGKPHGAAGEQSAAQGVEGRQAQLDRMGEPGCFIPLDVEDGQFEGLEFLGGIRLVEEDIPAPAHCGKA